MMARASSGSRSCSSSVDPLISANSAVTVLRSPSSPTPRSTSSLFGVAEGAGAAAAGGGALSGAPQSPQNLCPCGFSALHFGQRFLSSAPQLPQNFLLAGFSEPQLAQ